MKKILVLGNFGYNGNRLDGQTIKTRNTFQLITEFYSNVDFYDTGDYKVNKWSIFTMFYKIISCNVLIYLPAQNNLKFLFPLIFLTSILFDFTILYFVIGGWLREVIERLPIHQYMLRRVAGIYVETKRMKKELETDLMFCNIDIFPNFRFFDAEFKCDFSKIKGDCLNLCFVSRVEKSKGLDIMLKIYDEMSKESIIDSIKIDVYGMKTDSFFDEYLSDIKMFCYKGIVEPKDILGVLVKYDALLFPSHYEGEGCPGVLVEALSVGLPIIASDWKYNGEFVENGVNGYLCSPYDVDVYCNAIKDLQKDLLKRNKMGEESYKKKDYYSVSNARNMMSEIFSKKLK
jgi:glycosyltransferase involved in cell wall biosynthesis